MENRIIYRIVPSKTLPGWWDITISNTKFPIIIKKKTDALKIARMLANHMFAQGMNAQLVIHNRRGRITGEHTYGDDPVRSKG